jgi:hypothetical protein
MPAETHQHTDELDAETILDFLATVLGVDPVGADDLELVTLHVEDDLSILHLWAFVVEEFGERSVGDLSLEDERSATLGELAALFHGALQPET